MKTAMSSDHHAAKQLRDKLRKMEEISSVKSDQSKEENEILVGQPSLPPPPPPPAPPPPPPPSLTVTE